MPKGIPRSGQRAKGAGRKPLGRAPLVGVKVWLLPHHVEALHQLGGENVSAGLRQVLDERFSTDSPESGAAEKGVISTGFAE